MTQRHTGHKQDKLAAEQLDAALIDIGQRLRQGRRASKMTIAQLASSLKINDQYIRALEEGDRSRLPAMTYVGGYIRSYAKLVGLDAAGLQQELAGSLRRQDRRPDYVFPSMKLEKPSHNGRFALAGVVLCIGLYIGWYSLDTMVEPQPASTVEVASLEIPALIDEPDVQVVETAREDSIVALPLPAESPAVTADKSAPASEAAVDLIIPPEQPVAAAESAIEAAPVANSAETGVLATASLPDEAAPAMPESTSLEPSPPASGAVAGGRIPALEITITATATSWVEIQRADGSQIMARLMRRGEQFVVPSSEDAYLSSGNAGGVSVSFGEDTIEAIGGVGEVVREMPLDLQLIRQRL